MSTKINERTSIAINVASTDQTIEFNKLIITTAGTLKFQDASGNDCTVPGTVPVGEFPVQGQKIYKAGTTITGIACSY